MKSHHMLALAAVFVVGYFVGYKFPAIAQKTGV